MIDTSMIVNTSDRLKNMTTTPTQTRTALAETCCASLTQGALTTEDAAALALKFKALADPTRVRLLSIIAAQPTAEACVCDLTDPVGLSQPTVSHHMKQLVDASLVTRQQRGKWAYYALVPETLSILSTVLDPQALLTASVPQ